MCHGQQKAKETYTKDRHKNAIPYVRKNKHKEDFQEEYS